MINSVSGSSTPQGLGVAVDSPSDLKMDFLSLLTTQLANQDPLSPMDNEAMVAQLATFSQLEQLEGMNKRLEQQMQYSQSLNNTMMMDIVGKRVTVLGNAIEIQGGDPSRTLIRTVESGIGSAEIVDKNGTVVRTLSGIKIEPGYTEIEWDGLDDDGDPLPDGQYSIQVRAERVNGSLMSVAVFQSGIVDTVQFDNNAISLMVNGRLYSPSSVVEVGRAPSATSAKDPSDESGDDSTDPTTTDGTGDDPVPPTTNDDDPVLPGDPGTPPTIPGADPSRDPVVQALRAYAGSGRNATGPVWRAPWEALRGLR